ncbi:MAG: hypothetical protein ACLQO6_00470, partial [Desulfomonilaceae bacterium]
SDSLHVIKKKPSRSKHLYAYTIYRIGRRLLGSLKDRQASLFLVAGGIKVLQNIEDYILA